LFSTILGEASNSLVGNSNLIGKVYFPRLVIPSSSAVVALIDFAINLALLFGLMAWYSFAPSWHVIFLPAFVALAILASLGPAFLINALNVKYRDFRYIIPFILQFGLYISPVGFSSAIVPETWRFWYSPQPGGRRHRRFPPVPIGRRQSSLSAGVPAQPFRRWLFLWLGIRYFRRTERSFADLI
jgi:lipopolysaccharide transport system permease protein